MELKNKEAMVCLFRETIRLVNEKILSTDSLLWKGRFSYKKLSNSNHALKYIGKVVSLSSVISEPVTYDLFRQLKFITEGIEYPLLTLAEVEVNYNEVIVELWNLSGQVKSTVDLSRDHYALYCRVSKLVHWPLIKYLVFEGSTGEFLYWCDEDIINKAGDYENFTHLKYKGCNLHRHIMGRNLKSDVELRFPQYLTFARIGLGNKIYRSLGELVLGNMVVIAGAENDFIWQYDTGLCRVNSNKSMISDFYIKPLKLLIEISMFVENGRGSRGKSYDIRREEKLEIYNKMGIKYLFIDSSAFYKQGCFLSLQFALTVVEELNKFSYFTLNHTVDSDESKLGFFESLDVRSELTAEAYLLFLEEKFGLTHTAQLSQDMSFLRQIIKLRIDARKIFSLLKEKGKKRRKIRNKSH